MVPGWTQKIDLEKLMMVPPMDVLTQVFGNFWTGADETMKANGCLPPMDCGFDSGIAGADDLVAAWRDEIRGRG